jgi:hypothetical protein
MAKLLKFTLFFYEVNILSQGRTMTAEPLASGSFLSFAICASNAGFHQSLNAIL